MDLTPLAEVAANEGTALIRTDFADDSAWRLLQAEVRKPVDLDVDGDDEGYQPHVVPIEAAAFAGATGESLARAVAATGESHGYVLLADARSMAEAAAGRELTVDYVDLSVTDPEDAELFDTFLGNTFRCAVGEVALIEVNLSIANMDFSDFAGAVPADGVFRGFEEE